MSKTFICDAVCREFESEALMGEEMLQEKKYICKLILLAHPVDVLNFMMR